MTKQEAIDTLREMANEPISKQTEVKSLIIMAHRILCEHLTMNNLTREDYCDAVNGVILCSEMMFDFTQAMTVRQINLRSDRDE